MGQLADRLAHLASRYGSDAAAWQRDLHALAALETSDPKAALERFYALRRNMAEFRRAQLLRELRAFPFVTGVPSSDAKGYPAKEIEADIREAARALALARRIASGIAETDEALASLRVRRSPSPSPSSQPSPSSWTSLAAFAERVETARRVALREARFDRRLRDVERRRAKLRETSVAPVDATLDEAALDAALGEVEAALARAEAIEDAYAAALAPLKAPEVGSFKHETKRALEREAKALLSAADVDGLQALAARAEAVRVEAAKLASQAARSRRSGAQAPARERRPGDPIDPYG